MVGVQAQLDTPPMPAGSGVGGGGWGACGCTPNLGTNVPDCKGVL